MKGNELVPGMEVLMRGTVVTILSGPTETQDITGLTVYAYMPQRADTQETGYVVFGLHAPVLEDL